MKQARGRECFLEEYNEVSLEGCNEICEEGLKIKIRSQLRSIRYYCIYYVFDLERKNDNFWSHHNDNLESLSFWSLKEKFYRTAIRPTLLYDIEC